jgi:hypothetical protein
MSWPGDLSPPTRCAGAGRLAGGLAAALLLIAGQLAAAWVGVSPAAATPTPVWTNVSPSAGSPPARELAASADDPATGQLVLFGGTNGSYLGDTWTWNGTAWSLVSSTGGPSARTDASMAYDSATHQIVLFGGSDGTGYLGDTWTWNGTGWTLFSSTGGPSARADASMAYDAATGQIVLFGGISGGYLGDTWTWNGTGWTLFSSTGGPSARTYASMAYDSATQQIVLFGGLNGTVGYLGDTWTWTGTGWSLSSSTGPPAREQASMDYDQATSQLVLFGGFGGSYLGDTWAWDGTTWTQLSLTGPPGRYAATMAYDPTASQLVLFGGYNGSTGDLGDTWAFAVPAPVSPGPAPPTTVIRQVGPVAGRTSPGASAGFTAHLNTTGQHGWTRYVTTTKGCGVVVSPSGTITTTGRLSAGRCTVSGTDSDTGATADTGTWSYTLTIGAVIITQLGPKTATTTTTGSAAFAGHFRTKGGRGRVRYVTTSKACGVIVSPAGAISTAGRLSAGRCTVSGTDTDPGRASGKWSFTLTITAARGGGQPPGCPAS